MKIMYILIIFLMAGTWSYSQVNLTSMKKSEVKFKIPIAQKSIPGQTGYFQEYGDLAVLMDSLGIAEGTFIDSLKYNQTNDSLYLYTSDGVFKTYIPTFNLPTLTSGSVLFSNGTTISQNNANFFWDISNTRLGIGTSSPSANLHVTGNVRIEGGSGTPTTLMGRSSIGLINQIGLGSGFSISLGILNYTESSLGTVTSIATGNGITGGTITTTGTLGLTGQALVLHNYASNGIMVRNGTSSFINRTITAGTGISVNNGDGISGNPTITNTGDLSTTNELQTLSWSSPNLSISSGNSVTLPVLPAGTSTHTLAYLSGAWTSSSFLKTNSSNTTTGNFKRVSINDDGGGETFPLTVHSGTKFLVNGRVQMNSTASSSVTSMMGRNADAEVGTVTTGANMELTAGTLSKRQVLGVLARNSGSGSFSTSSTPAKLDFNLAFQQVNSTASTTNDNILTSITGYGAYEIKCDCQFNPGSTTVYNFGIYVNGSLNGPLVNQIPMTSGVTDNVVMFGWVSSLTTAEAIDIRVSTSSGTTGNTIGRCYLTLSGL